MQKIIDIYTDGAVSGNPGPGGAAAVIRDFTNKKIISVGSFDKETTNQRMELTGIILGLKTILEKRTVNNIFELITINIFSDSAYCVRAFNEGWLEKWKDNGWTTANRKAVANQDLWKEIDRLLYECNKYNLYIHFIKVKGHSGNTYNEIADQLAVYCKTRQLDMYNVADIVEVE